MHRYVLFLSFTLIFIHFHSDRDAENCTSDGTDTQITNTVTVWRMLRGKVCHTVISLPTHAHPVSDSDFLVFSVCLCNCVWGRTKESSCQTQKHWCFSAQAADPSTIISWIVWHTQHLSQTHKLPLSHALTQPLYGHYCQGDAVQLSLTCSFLSPSFPFVFRSLFSPFSLPPSRQFLSWSSD